VYQITIKEEPYMMLVTKANKDCPFSSYSAEGNTLMFGWTDGSSESPHSDGSVDSTESIQGLRHFINVRKMALGTDQVEQDIVVELSHRKDTVSL
jgi:hypothetical protein